MPDWTAPRGPQKSELEFTRPERQLARPQDRLAAVIVDVFVILLPVYLLVSAPLKRVLTTSFLLGAEAAAYLSITVMLALAFLVLTGYQTITIYYLRATFGKRLFGLRVESVHGFKLSLWDCFCRALIWTLELALGGLPWLALFSNHQRRPLHDRICECIVVTNSPSGADAPRAWQGRLVRGVFALALLFGALTVFKQIEGALEVLKIDKALFAAGGEERTCEAVDHFVAADSSVAHARLAAALSMFSAGLVERSCLESEVERETADHTHLDAMTYLAQAFVNADDADVSNSYLDQACTEAPASSECAMSKLVGAWSDGNSETVGEILKDAPVTSGYLNVWAVRHYMKQAHYDLALKALDHLIDHREVAEFTLNQRVKALISASRETEANAALSQAIPVLPEDQALDLRAWVCTQQMQNGCAAAQNLSCAPFQATPAEAGGEDEMAAPVVRLARLMTSECHGPVDYKGLSEGTGDDTWEIFLRANHKWQKQDLNAAADLFDKLIASSDTADTLRVEAVRRLLQFADKKQMASLHSRWREIESREAWVKSGHLILARLNSTHDPAARQMAAVLNRSGGPRETSARLPASVDDVDNVDEDGQEP